MASSLGNPRFKTPSDEAAYLKLKRDSSITISKTLDQSKLNFPISDLFSQTCFLFLLTLAYPFHSEFLYEFFANLRVPFSHDRLTSRVFCRDIEITKQDLSHFLHIPSHGLSAHDLAADPNYDWSRANRVLRNSSLHQHSASVSGLVQNARVTQHILRHAILPKAGDRTNITPILSIVTYFCMTQTPFDAADLLIRYIDNISSVRDPRTKKKTNLALGHLIAYIIQHKYDLGNPEEADHHPVFFSDHSFHSIYGGKKQRGKRPAEEEEEEEEAREIPTQGEPSSSYPPYSTDSLTERFDRLELKVDQLDAHFGRMEAQQEQRWAQEEQHWTQQAQYWADQEKNWEWLRSRFGGDPPDQGPSFF